MPLGFATAGRFGGTVGVGVRMGDFFRKTDGEGIWISIRLRPGDETWTPANSPPDTASGGKRWLREEVGSEGVSVGH